MKAVHLLLTLCTLAVTVTAQKVVPIGISRPLHKLPPIHRRANTWTQELKNNLTGGGYYADVEIGTPGQKVSLILDTGSSDVWVLDKNADLCTNSTMQYALGGGCIATYTPSDSSTYEEVGKDEFSIQYVDRSGASGDYIKENLKVGGSVIKGLQMGLAEKSSINSGLLGIGFSSNVVADEPYPNIMDELLNQGLIKTRAYSLYLNDLFSSTGNILFGGLDTEKYIGKLVAVPIMRDKTSNAYTSFTVALSSLTVMEDNDMIQNFTRQPVPVIVDSGTTLTYLPTTMATRVYTKFQAVDDTDYTGLVYIDCKYLKNTSLTFDFQFGGSEGPLIRVPVDEMVLDNVKAYVSLGLQLPNLPFYDVCSFGIQPNDGIYLLGDTFLRSAYVVYHLDSLQIALGQANMNSTRSNIIEMNSDQKQIPDITGVASQVSVTQTATGVGGVGGGTPTGSGGSESAENSGVRALPAPNLGAAGVVAIAGVGMLLGGILVVT